MCSWRFLLLKLPFLDKAFDLRHDALNGCHLETLDVRLQGKDGVIFNNMNT